MNCVCSKHHSYTQNKDRSIPQQRFDVGSKKKVAIVGDNNHNNGHTNRTGLTSNTDASSIIDPNINSGINSHSNAKDASLSPNQLSLVKIAVHHTILISYIGMVSLVSCAITIVDLLFYYDHKQIAVELSGIMWCMVGITVNLVCLGLQWPFAIKLYKTCCKCCCYYKFLQNIYTAKMIRQQM